MKQLTYQDRKVIMRGLDMRHRQSTIARAMGLHRSTICNEIKRNSVNNVYDADIAHKMATERRKKANQARAKKNNKQLVEYIKKELKKTDSPEQISNRAKETNEYNISHQTIYVWAREWYFKDGIDYLQYFRRLGKITIPKYKKGKKQTYNKRKRESDNQKRSIKELPAEAKNITETGHIEGDTVAGTNEDRKCVATFTDRFCGAEVSILMKKKTAKEFKNAVLKAAKKIKMKTLILDNGAEMSLWQEIEKELPDLKIYFANPANPGQRGLNENTNGLIRQFLPKKYSFKFLRQSYLDTIDTMLNHRPRKRYNYRTPFEVYNDLPPCEKNIPENVYSGFDKIRKILNDSIKTAVT